MIKAKYTVVLDTLLRDETFSQRIKEAMSTYPLYEKRTTDEQIPTYIPTRDELNEKILRYYRFREIGFETPERFAFELETALKEIMPYYNQLFFSADQDYDMLYNVDYVKELKTQRDGTTSLEGTTTGTSTTNSNATDDTTNDANIKTVNSKTPQGELSITAANIDNISYADEVNWNKDSGHTHGTSSTTGTNTNSGNNSQTGINAETETTTETTKGNYGMVTFQSLIEKYRALIINVEQQIINDPRIQELFMIVY